MAIFWYVAMSTATYSSFLTWRVDHVGVMHTGQNELKHRKLMGKAPLHVDLMHLAMLLGSWIILSLPPTDTHSIFHSMDS